MSAGASQSSTTSMDSRERVPGKRGDAFAVVLLTIIPLFLFADVLFFGSKGPKSKPVQVDHMGIALGNGWMIHSSRFGVTVVPLQGWWHDGFAWARRPLAEAGIEVTF